MKNLTNHLLLLAIGVLFTGCISYKVHPQLVNEHQNRFCVTNTAGAKARPYTPLLASTINRTPYIFALATDPVAGRVAVAVDRRVLLCDARTGQILRQLVPQGDWVLTVAFSADGRWIVAGGGDQIVHVYDVEHGNEICAYQGHEATIRTAVFSPDGRRIIVGDDAGVVRIWNLDLGTTVLKESFVGAKVWSVAVAPDGRWVAIAVNNEQGGKVLLWDLQTGRLMRELLDYTESTGAMVFVDSNRLATAGATIKLWDARTGQALWSLPWPTTQPAPSRGRITSLAVSADGRWLAAGWADRVRVWGTVAAVSGDGQEWVDVPGGKVAFGKDGSLLMGGGWCYPDYFMTMAIR